MKTKQAMKKLMVSIVLVGGFVLYSLTHGRTDASPSAVLGPSSTLTNGNTAGSQTTATASAGLRAGTYTGSVSDAQWGYVQVQVTIQQGKITSLQFLQYPHDRERSVIINQYADPQLVTEAIQAQSAQVDAITGATDTSFAFMQSLSDALAQAQG
jgi:uncharacterized protein with FMN-binding domain